MARISAEKFKTAIWAPGATTAGDDIDLPSYFADMSELIGAVLWDVATGITIAETSLTVDPYDGSVPASAHITMDDSNTLDCGSNTTDKHLLLITYRAV